MQEKGKYEQEHFPETSCNRHKCLYFTFAFTNASTSGKLFHFRNTINNETETLQNNNRNDEENLTGISAVIFSVLSFTLSN